MCQGCKQHGSGCLPVAKRSLINDGPVMLAGPGMITQIDESQFKNKPKVLLAKIKL